MPQVRHIKAGYPPEAVYIGRPSKWGNPWWVGRDGTREEVVEKYREWAYIPTEEGERFREEVRRELQGHDLVCFCAPRACHGDILLEIANKEVG